MTNFSSSWASLRQFAAIALALVLLSTVAAVAPAGAVLNADVTFRRHVVRLDINGDTSDCTGTLIGSEWVLTAGHCVDSDSNEAGVQLFEEADVKVTLISADTGRLVTFNAESLIPNPDYRPGVDSRNDSRDDVALIRLSVNDTTVRHITTSRPTLATEDPASGTELVLSGYGRSAVEETARSNVFTSLPSDGQQRSTQVTVDSQCRDSRTFCVTVVGSNSGACSGDSGGPVITDNIIYGVASTAGFDTGQCGLGATEASVARHRTWIRRTVGGQCEGQWATVIHGFGEIGTDRNDVIAGTDLSDTIFAGEGFDRICGNAGHDTIFGQGGVDRAFGQAGNDTIYGADGFDRLDGGIGIDTIRGGHGADHITGGDGGDKLYGDNGDDLIEGGDGWDDIWGGRHQDRLHGQGGNDEVWGNEGNDDIWGGTGNDQLFGLYGASDNLRGGSGTDHCNGGVGNNDRAVQCNTRPNVERYS